MVDVYDGNDEKIMPETVTYNNTNEMTLTFSTPISGYCGVIPVGNPSLGGDIINKFTGNFTVKLGNGEELDD
jgi:hypothetical protein